jgi:hypothetical protein
VENAREVALGPRPENPQLTGSIRRGLGDAPAGVQFSAAHVHVDAHMPRLWVAKG